MSNNFSEKIRESTQICCEIYYFEKQRNDGNGRNFWSFPLNSCELYIYIFFYPYIVY